MRPWSYRAPFAHHLRVLKIRRESRKSDLITPFASKRHRRGKKSFWDNRHSLKRRKTAEQLDFALPRQSASPGISGERARLPDRFLYRRLPVSIRYKTRSRAPPRPKDDSPSKRQLSALLLAESPAPCCPFHVAMERGRAIEAHPMPRLCHAPFGRGVANAECVVT